jgi:hypothetical protein
MKICNKLLLKMMAAKLIYSEIKQQRNIRGEDPHLSPSNGVELPSQMALKTNFANTFQQQYSAI